MPNEPRKSDIAKSVVLNFFLFVIMILPPCYAIIELFDEAKYGRIKLAMLTFAFAFVIDQGKSPIILALIWYMITRRSGFLLPNEKEYIFKAVKLEEGQIDPIEYVRGICFRVIENRWFNFISGIIWTVYSLVIVVWLIFAEQMKKIEKIFDIIDYSFLGFFFAEACFKIFAIGSGYICDFWNIVDMILITLTFFFNIFNFKPITLPPFRLLRVGALTIRKLGGNPIKIGSKKKEENPLQYALDALKEIKEHRMMPAAYKTEILWLSKKIEINKLNEVSIDKEHPLFKDPYAQLYIGWSTHKFNETNGWYDSDTSGNDITKVENEEEVIEERQGWFKEFLKDTELQEANKVFEDRQPFSYFSFNPFDLYDALRTNEKILKFVGLKLFIKYNIFSKIDINYKVLLSLLGEISKEIPVDNPLHKITHTIEVLKAIDFFLSDGNIKTKLKEIYIASLVIAGCIIDLCHPYKINVGAFRMSTSLAKALTQLRDITTYQFRRATLFLRHSP